MSKSTIWNSLKELGYDSQQLKAEYNKTYQSANESLLQSILHKLQPTVVNEVVVTNDAVQDMYAIKLPPASKKDKRYLGFNGHTVSNIENAGRWDIESARELMEELNLQNSKLIMVSSDTEPTVTEQANVPETTLDSSSDTTDTVQDVLPLSTKFNWSQNTYPSDDDCAVYIVMDNEYHRVEKVTKQLIKDVVSRCKYKLSDLYDPTFYGDPLPTFEVINQPIVTMPVEVTTVDDPWLVSFNVDSEVVKLKQLSPDKFFNLIDEVVDAGKYFANYYIPKPKVIEQYLTAQELVFFNNIDKAEDASEEFLQKLIDIQEAYSIVGREWEKRKIHYSSYITQSSVTANTTDKVEIPEQVQQPSTVVTEATETTSSKVDEMPNSYSFAFQETKLPINVLEVHSNNGKKIEVVNLTDAYFIELRNNKLYISYGLNIKTFHSNTYRIIKAFNSLLNGSNFIHLRDKREHNRDILVNLNRVKTIERNSKFIKFHWNGWLTYPGYHDLNDWQVID